MSAADTPALVDTHCHLDVAAFDADRGDVLARARAAGVVAQIIPAIGIAGFEKIHRLCQAEAGLYPAWGLHPMYLQGFEEAHLEVLGTWLERHRPVAVGECGLDFYIDDPDVELQRRVLVRHLELARAFDLPLILHARRAVEEVIAHLRRFPGLRGVVHSFSGSLEQARQLWDLGFHLGIGGPVTYPRANRIRTLVASMPIEQLLLETDAPDQPLSHRRGERNEPAHLVGVLETIAELRQESPATITASTTRNACTLFGLLQTSDA